MTATLLVNSLKISVPQKPGAAGKSRFAGSPLDSPI